MSAGLHKQLKNVVLTGLLSVAIAIAFVCVRGLYLWSSSSSDGNLIRNPVMFSRIDSAFQISGEKIANYRCGEMEEAEDGNYIVSCSHWINIVFSDLHIFGNISGKSGEFTILRLDSSVDKYLLSK